MQCARVYIRNMIELHTIILHKRTRLDSMRLQRTVKKRDAYWLSPSYVLILDPDNDLLSGFNQLGCKKSAYVKPA